MPAADSTFLFLRGWIYPTDASINVALSQQSQVTPMMPSLDVRDAHGRWTTAVPNLGFPSGKDKTMVVPLSGIFPTGDHHVRIRTNLQIYWDQAFVARDVATSPCGRRDSQPSSADLHFRGYSRTYRKGGRYGPWWFDYDSVTKGPMWRPIEGAFTRFGDVLPLLESSDDMYVIMAPGDEATLAFDAASADSIPRGWKRDFLLYTDGWIKDSDLNTAFGTTVGPLPFHAIREYPYARGESYPTDSAHRRYLRAVQHACGVPCSSKIGLRPAPEMPLARRCARCSLRSMTSPSHPTLRRAIVAVPFLAAIAAAARMDRGAALASADAARPGFALHDETSAAGIHFVHHRPSFDPKIANIEPHVAALGASVSVADFDGDGWPDLYFTNSRFGEPNALYRNKHDGTFEEVAASAGLADLNRPGEGVSMGAVWGDFDNDGREDVLVYRYGYLALFKNLDGRHFQDVTEAAGLRRWVNSNGAIWIDYDRDGLLDLYVTAYFRDDVDLWHLATTRIMHNSFEFATNGGKNLMFHNLGNGRFEDVTDKLGVGSTRWTLAAAAADFNEDGWPDIYLANDYGPEELYLNDHGRRFTLATAGLESESKSGMSVALGDVYGRGHLDVFVTNISERGYLFQNNNLRLNRDDRRRRAEAVSQHGRRDGCRRRGMGVGRAVRGSEQRRRERTVRRQRIHLRPIRTRATGTRCRRSPARMASCSRMRRPGRRSATRACRDMSDHASISIVGSAAGSTSRSEWA